MKKLVLSLLVIVSAAVTTVYADQSVKGYTKKDGTYVDPYKRSDPNGSKADNWSSKGNTNPYTGKEGTKDPYAPSNPYGKR